jgi:hypothetical protein
MTNHLSILYPFSQKKQPVFFISKYKNIFIWQHKARLRTIPIFPGTPRTY